MSTISHDKHHRAMRRMDFAPTKRSITDTERVPTVLPFNRYHGWVS